MVQYGQQNSANLARNTMLGRFAMQNDFGFNFDNTYATLPESFFSLLGPSSLTSPELVLFNDELARFLGLSSEAMRNEDGIAFLAGTKVPPGGVLLAQAYAGHQFSHFTMLGDGRALLLGEQITPSGERYDIQLKGSGRTPYSRGGDGKATLGPMLREYIVSEAMAEIFPTTRSLAVITTGEKVARETLLPGAVLTRVAKSHLRVGTFQFAAGRGRDQELKTLADYAINRHYPEAFQDANPYLSFYRAVVHTQASLIAQWMLIGFVHGVMNTDNMAISGETIDYGPCAFLDIYDPSTVYSSIDHYGRYAYGNQPKIAAWNLARFAETLLPLIDSDQEKARDLATIELESFSGKYDQHFLAGMRKKLGLKDSREEDAALIHDLLELMREHQADYTNTFLDLTFQRFDEHDLYRLEGFASWRERWEKRRGTWEEAQALMKRSNPALIPRNHRVEEVLRAAVQERDYKPLKKLLSALKEPFAHSPEQAEFASPPESNDIPYRTFCGT